jgi:hypothetical protein
VKPIRDLHSLPNPSLKTAGNGPGKEVIRMATRKIGRSAITGKFMPVRAAQSGANRRTAIVQTIKTKPSKR